MNKHLRWALIGVAVSLLALVAAAQDTTPLNQTYEVQPRDTLDGIGAQFDVRWQCLAEVNSIANPYTDLKPGMVLTIDFSCPRYEGLDFVANPREGATVPIESLGQGGGASGDAPAPGPDDTTYTVREAQTLDTIAQELDISVISLQIANGLGPLDRIFPGQTLVIPAGAPPYGQFPPLADPVQGANSDLGQGGGVADGTEYVVQPRDTLDQIAARFDFQTDCLAERNSLVSPIVIYPGQVIVLPDDCPRYDGFDVVTNPRDGGNG
jgi:LysM repeat protein